VKTLSNFHSPTIVEGGMKRRVRDPVTKKRAREQSDVYCNAQQIDYCLTYHHIDKGGFSLELSFSKRVAEVRISPKFFEIL
jgi:hypothetical protein